MHAGIYGRGAPDASVRAAKRMLGAAGIRSSPVHRRPGSGGLDCVIVLGGDRGVRSYFRGAADPGVPVLGVSEAESGGFLAQIDLKELPAYAARLRGGDYIVEELPRLGVRTDGGAVRPVLNDVAVFPSKSAMLMEHTLRIDGEEVWHDSSDGIMVSTPLGSSAYSMSVGGPVIFPGAPVFEVISVNSLDVTRRPLIVSGGSSIEIEEISSRLHCEVILDGTDRYSIGGTVSCARFDPPARIIKMRGDSTAISALAKKVRLAEDLLKMPPSSKLILKTLEYEGRLSQKELASKTLLPDRTVRLALSHLLDRGHVKRKISARDARQKIYEIAHVG
ncbi:sugar kinase [Cenarchaeum symbiosum A]|uniref:NAD kinase n=1 Tax=Cenarchaeum symbiosum (strain A) TaxID=414004 RepID=A0RX29_CENSY|nr:sugar kinase [Cenarchaeum symbiosum A]